MKKAISPIYYCKIKRDELVIHMFSSIKGAVCVRVHLKGVVDAKRYPKDLFPLNRIIADKEINSPLKEAVEAALEGRPIPNDLPLDIPSYTSFQMRTWKTISQIPFGKKKTYGEVACMLGIGKQGARAVGQVMKRNQLLLIFP